MTKVLMVCLGNICRSPLAEGILRQKAEKENLSLFIDSAGTSNYHTGEHPDSRTIANAKKNGIDVSKLKARQFKITDFDLFDHIFVMDTTNYNDVISMIRNEQDKSKVEMILNRVYPNSNMSVPDPYFGGEQGFENVFILLDKACEVIIESFKNNKNS
ncbi:MAG: low molecular weight phosphotyrosine protein phosphatase [Bacteroidia bacterium]|nr:low molecular weight phosphotyrosine protein phosphatase [Bacteroidia bacterium]